MHDKTIARIATKLESMMLWAEDVWSMEEGVGEHVTDALDKAGITITMTPEEYYENELGKGSPYYEDNVSDCDFATISVWTP